MVETRRDKKRKENPKHEKEKKAKSYVRVKFVRTVSLVSSTALEKRNGTMEQTETMALEKMTMTEKTSDVSKPINVRVDVVDAVEATESKDDKTDTNDNEENSVACDEENEREDTASENNVDKPDEFNGRNENAEEEELKEVEESEEEVGNEVANNVEESSDESGNADDSIGNGNVGEVREDNANEENPNPVESERDHKEESDETQATEAIKPSRMFFSPSEYKKKIKLGTRCMIVDAVKTLEKLKLKLSNVERIWFEEHHQFRHFFHMKRENNHNIQEMWMLLARTTESSKRREVWFIVNGVPIRYGLREHTLILELNCCNYPLDYKACGGTKFVKRHFKEGEPIRLEDVKEKLVKMGPHRDRLKMAVMFFLGSVVRAQTKVGKCTKNILDFFQRAVDDLDFCQTFPWGRYSYYCMLKEISHTMDHFGGVVKANTLWPLPEPVEGADVKCPRMCKSTFKPNRMKEMSLSMINKELGHETDIHSIIPTKTPQEEYLLDEIMEDEDDVDEPDLAVDSWDKRMDEGLSIFFKDMYDEDVTAREEHAKEIEDTA
ncbi:hypothetical protein N665_0082s0032 [Sinapis alba]|nr:hypothetical protein N665_0082s0032 [Sinapis alba]